MPSLSTIKESNALIPNTLPPNPVALFVGGTKGIGAHSLLAFARHAASLNPRIYVIARSTSPAVAQAQALLSSGGSITFLPCDASLIKDADRMCAEIRKKEPAINLLFMSQGTLDMQSTTKEGLPLMAGLVYYSRIRFAQNLMPALRAAKGWRRVVNVLAGTKEGPVDKDDWHLKKGGFNPIKMRGQGASMLTMASEVLAKEAHGEVGFIHSFPGYVVSDVGKTMKGWVGVIMRFMTMLLSPFRSYFAIPGDECGERHIFLATSSSFAGDGSGVELKSVKPSRETDAGSGNFAVDEHCETGNNDDILRTIRDDGSLDKMWKDMKLETEKALSS